MKSIDIVIKTFPIRLGQFLKLASIVSDGIEGKVLIASGEVTVNGVQELRRGKQLFTGDIVSVGPDSYTCKSALK